MISPIIGKTPADYLKGLNKLANISCPNAKALMNISLCKPSELKSNKDYIIKKNKDIANIRKNLKLPKSNVERIFIYSQNSELAQDLSNSKNIKQAVQDWKSGKIKDKNGNPAFKFVVTANDTKDLKRAINGCTLTGLKEQPDGSVTGYVYDVYNFDSKFTEMNAGSKDLSFVNSLACKLQQLGFLHNYQILVPITIKFDKKI